MTIFSRTGLGGQSENGCRGEEEGVRGAFGWDWDTKNGLLFGEPVEGEAAWDRRGTFLAAAAEGEGEEAEG